MSEYVALLIMFAVAGVVTAGFYAASVYLGKQEPNPAKDQPFECGNPSEGVGNARPSVKFYLTALFFVVFDIEAVMIYPWAVEFRSLGWVGFATMASFIGLLAVVLVYIWKKGALQWEK